jgi:hypothetical protein
MGTNLVIHHGVTNILSQSGQYLRILDVVEESSGSAPLCQRFQISKSIFQLPGNANSVSTLELIMSTVLFELLPSLYLLDLALRSRSA